MVQWQGVQVEILSREVYDAEPRYFHRTHERTIQ
jgi:hypothetical protein